MFLLLYSLVVALKVSKRDDKDIPEAEKLSDTKEYMLSKRMISLLDYPSDCNRKKLTNFATGIGLKVRPGSKHYKVFDGPQLLTTIPHSVKSNPTCKSIIYILNNRATAQMTTPHPL